MNILKNRMLSSITSRLFNLNALNFSSKLFNQMNLHLAPYSGLIKYNQINYLSRRTFAGKYLFNKICLVIIN